MALSYLADKSALARNRNPMVYAVLTPLLENGEVATCAIVDLEMLFSAMSPSGYVEAAKWQRSSCATVPVSQAICEEALDTQAKLAARSHHRGASIPDLLIAACAAHHGLTVLHYDADYDLIAEVTGQPTRWVVPRGTVD